MNPRWASSRSFINKITAFLVAATAAVCLFAAEGRAQSETTTAAAVQHSPFAIRGTLPWHNFLSGPTAWNEKDYREYLDDLAARGLNFVGFHCYTGGAERYVTYVEPLIRMRYRGVLPDARFDTSLTARWGYRPLAVKDFAFDTSRLFSLPFGAEGFGAESALAAASNEERYGRAHDLMRKVISMAHERGIQVAIGFEFGIHPPELLSLVPPDSRIQGAMLPDPTHPANIEILHSALDDILTEYPGVDWVWLWLHEHSSFIARPTLSGQFQKVYDRDKGNFVEAAGPQDVFTGVWSLEYIRQARDHLAKKAPGARLVIGGWGGGAQLPAVLPGLDRALPNDVVFSCLNPDQGAQAHLPILADIARRRPVWSMSWLEGDSALWLPQPRVGPTLTQVKAAADDNLSGVVAIHWRTEEVRDSLDAFSTAIADPKSAPTPEAMYERICRERYGPACAVELTSVLAHVEQRRWLPGGSTPEYFPYDPTNWGQVKPGPAMRLSETLDLVSRLTEETTAPAWRANLQWLGDSIRFVLLLDQTSRKLEPAWKLRASAVRDNLADDLVTSRARAARAEFRKAPVEDLFRTFARRVRSRGELGELSSLNQKLWLEYQDLDRFLTSAGAP